jgi:ABC-2 type transport system permease protein
MSARTTAIRAGLQRGWIEARQTVTNVTELMGWHWPSVVALGVLYALSGNTVPGTALSMGTHAIPGLLGMNIVMSGMLGLAVTLTMEREDGTLLRMKAIPNGMLGYLIGKVVSQAGLAVAVLLLVLVPATLLFDELEVSSALSWLTLAWVLALGLIATLPLGAIIGSLFANPQSLGMVTLAVTGLIGISGIFYPITALPLWLQWIGQAFPIYWLGLGMRSALLPTGMAVAEIGESWRHLETVGVLGIWSIVGYAVAPMVLRRMARRQAGSRVAAPPSSGRQAATARQTGR